MDSVDRLIVNKMQAGFPVCERPYHEAAAEMGLSEDELIARLQVLLDDGILTRFGPLYHAEMMG
ncbi:MAG: Lrp/AsnC family transcriptional regulator, partial [Gammaproteobacteria bacterium]